jgi:uncharacterized protein (TIGR02271 family)
MTTRTVTAMFNSRADAERAAQQLSSELGVDRAMVRTSPESVAGNSVTQPGQDTGFLASLKNLFLPEEDQYAYAEGVRRGSVLVTATVDEGEVNRASGILESAGAVDLDEQEASWRKSGWSGYDASTASATPLPAATAISGETAKTAAASGRDEVIPVVEEKLVVGKRDVGRGSVRVRSYVVERPVEQQVSLHEERVDVDRRPVDRPLTEADRAAAFQDRTIEATATSEEAVVGKEARVVEEIALRKESSDRTETVRDTVRKTEVEVEDGKAGLTGTRATTGTTTDAGLPGNAATRAVDRTLDTNISGANPAADAPDGTPGNPPGTKASRAVDKTLGTNISGANPGRKT